MEVLFGFFFPSVKQETRISTKSKEDKESFGDLRRKIKLSFKSEWIREMS